MATLKPPLSKLRHEFGENIIDTESGFEVFHTDSPHSLIQAAGYLKHTRAQSERKGVFFRGQISLYPTLQSTLLRGTTDGPQNVKRRKLLADFLEKVDADKKALKAVNKSC